MKGDLRGSTLVRWRLRVRAGGAARGPCAPASPEPGRESLWNPALAGPGSRLVPAARASQPWARGGALSASHYSGLRCTTGSRHEFVLSR